MTPPPVLLVAAWAKACGYLAWLRMPWLLGRPTHLVFISYSRKNEMLVEEFQDSLRLYDDFVIKFVVDVKSLTPGTRFVEQIPALIRKSDFMILALSPQFVCSKFIRHHELPVIFKQEKRGRPVAPVYLEACNLSNLLSAE